jgi:hypothetical protein
MDEGSVATTAQTRRAANEHVRQTVDAVGDEETGQEWSFFCECGDPQCEATVRLRVETYDAIVRASDEHVLAPGHVVERAERARRRAADVRESAQALHGQARQVVGRMSSGRRRTVCFRAEMLEAELYDAAEDIEQLLVDFEDLDLTPSVRDLLFALDEAITAGLRKR